MLSIKTQREKRARRHRRVRARVAGSADRPRLSVFKSNTAVYGQLIDDAASESVCAADTRHRTEDTLSNRAYAAGVAIAKQASEKGIHKAVFDRGGFIYTGAVKAFADGARAGGLEF